MPVVNAEIAAQLEKIADMLEIEDASPFRVRAYRRAARTVSGLTRSVVEMLEAGEDLDDLPGIGEDLATKIAQLARGEHVPLLDELSRDVPPGLAALLDLPGLGPKRVRLLHDTLGIDSVESLLAASRSGRLREVPGIGKGIEARLLDAVAKGRTTSTRTRLAVAEEIAAPLVAHLRRARGVVAAEIAGSYRRRRETVGDLDIVVAAEPAGPAISAFTSYDGVAEVVEQGTTRATILLRGGLQVDLRVVPPSSHGAALCYFTGSKAHNIALRRIAIGQGLKLNEYGLFRGEAQVAGATEDDIYARLGLHAAPPPELREDTGEIDAARAGRLPDLVQLDDIRGDLHVHTEASDGQASLRAMAEAAKALGRDYVAITDHSRHLTVANGLDAARLARQIDEIARLNATLSGIVVLASTEVDILEDGSLDLPDDILHRLDLVVGAVHSAFDLPREKQTERLLRAMDNPCLDIVAHPTGRLLDSRAPYAIDLERVLRGACQRGCHLEANAQPARLDLDGAGCRMAKEIGVRIAISTDAHAPGQLGLMRFGVDQARRGWLEKDDVLNTRTLAGLRRLLRRR